jgi:Stage II sporulation protein E (SpoIIE)
MKPRALLAWLATGAVAAVVLLWAFPRVDPLEPEAWTIDRAEAEAIARERAHDVGEPPAHPFVVVTRSSSELQALRLHDLLASGVPTSRIRASRAAQMQIYWQATLHDPAATSGRWSHRVRLAPSGAVLQLERQPDDNATYGVLDPDVARETARAFLVENGYDLSAYQEPQLRTTDLENRTDTSVRYIDREALFGDGITYGVDVKFAGDELVGLNTFVDDPNKDTLSARFQGIGLWQQLWVFLPILLVPLVAVPFVRRYHAGEIGVRRGMLVAAAVLAGSLLTLVLTAKGVSAQGSFSFLTQPQLVVAIFFQFVVVFYFPISLLAFLSWSVGESLCRENWGHKLAAFDALFRGAWNNTTFARAALRGVVGGLAILAVSTLTLLLRPAGWAIFDFASGAPAWDSVQWAFVPAVAFAFAYSLYTALFGQLFLVPWLAHRLGRWAGPALAAVISALLFFPLVAVVPLAGTFVYSILFYGAAVVIFLRYGIFASFIAQLTVNLVPIGIQLLHSGGPTMELNGALILLAPFVPLLASVRSLASDREFVYRYEDVPLHVRRIAERERQKVELETARGIQSSILPELPPQLNGVQLSHRYLPATEVGGDFYDVLALEDGRLAVAVGDVAGHGVSSGLVMSMAKSALAVQVTFDPEVEAVFGTLNRMVFQSARRRLLTTLCYALIDPRKGEMFYASAGHLFPYRVTHDGAVEALESVSYPLGVRDTIEIRTRAATLAPGDKLFLYSDGVVEAIPQGGAEPFGFERLEESLRRHAARDVHGLRDGVLRDLEAFAGTGPLEDDLTVLVLQLP